MTTLPITLSGSFRSADKRVNNGSQTVTHDPPQMSTNLAEQISRRFPGGISRKIQDMFALLRPAMQCTTTESTSFSSLPKYRTKTWYAQHGGRGKDKKSDQFLEWAIRYQFHHDRKPMQSIIDILHKNFQEDHTNSRRFPGVVDTLHLINNATTHFIKTSGLMKMQHCSISVTQIYTDDRCVKKLVRSWQFTAAICSYILLTQYWQSLHSFRKEQVSLWGNYMACIKCTNMSFAIRIVQRMYQYSLCTIRQYRIRMFVLSPPIKWIKNISCSIDVINVKIIIINVNKRVYSEKDCKRL